MKSSILQKRNNLARRAHRTRTRVRGTSARPRLSVFRSLKHISAQMINDETGRTLCSASDMKMDKKGLKPVEVATKVGDELALKAKAAGVTTVVFDRGGYRFHGRVKAIAEAARAAGLEF